MNAYEFIVRMKNYASSELRRISRDLGNTDRDVRRLNEDMKKTESISKSLGNAFGGLKGKLIGLFAGISLLGFTNQVIEARSEYEKFDAVLTNTFQNKEVGQGALALLTDFAAKTPYQLNELTGSFIKLVNRGVLPTRNELTALGDLASSQGKSFDQLTEAILDAQTGEFERMKEFGIRASKDGGKVSLTFKGITKEVQMNDQAIKDAIISYGQMKGVAGSMDVISKTLGGRLSNLADQWWSFLVAVGGYSGGIMGDTLGLIVDGLAFLQDHLPQIAHWFELLWQYLTPLVKSLKAFFKEAIQGVFGISDSKSALESFGNVMMGVLTVVDWLSTGIATFLDWIRPLAPYLLDAAIAFGVFNLVMSLNPVSLIIIGIVTLMTVIGFLMKYTDGWSKSWTALGNLLKLWWQQVKADFRMGVDIAIYQFNRLRYSAFEIFDKIAQKIANVGKAIKQALEFDFSGAYNTMNKQVTSDWTKKIQENEANFKKGFSKEMKDSADRYRQAKKELGNIGVEFKEDQFNKDWNKLKNSFKNISGDKLGDPAAYEDYLNKNKGLKPPGAKDKDKDKSKKDKDGIVSGGSKQMNIVINIDKVGTDTKIYVDSSEKGVQGLGDKVTEGLLRAVNNINQMQTNGI
ncbi:hypothetical protein [Chryseobacterium sp. KCF3-3]|uniref:hypothetical protein n=1 Tax=Chryseobacterium sp. KCF3-3 TaxID=3231511 RepID=UPI0038B38E6F